MHRGAWRVMGLQKSQMQLMDHASIWGPVHPKHSILAVFLHLEFPCPWMTNMVNGVIPIELKGRQRFFFFPLQVFGRFGRVDGGGPKVSQLTLCW